MGPFDFFGKKLGEICQWPLRAGVGPYATQKSTYFGLHWVNFRADTVILAYIGISSNWDMSFPNILRYGYIGINSYWDR